MAEKKKEIVGEEKDCWVHGSLKVRGRTFRGYIIRKSHKRIIIEFERTIYVRKYERYMKKKTRIHARIPKCMEDKVNVGDYVLVGECRPLSKMIHHVFLRKLLTSSQFSDDQKSDVRKISDIRKVKEGGEDLVRQKEEEINEASPRKKK